VSFTGQHIVVTGASSGIGLVTAKLLAARGAKVSMIARRAELLDEVAKEIGPSAAGFAADVGDKQQLDQALEAAEGYFGPANGLFANAGLTGGFTPAVAFDPDMFEETIRVNLVSVFWAIQKVLPSMTEAKKGAILVTGSMASKRGMAMNPGDRGRDGAAQCPRQLYHPRLHQDRGAFAHPARAAGQDRAAHSDAPYGHERGTCRGRVLSVVRRGKPCHRAGLGCRWRGAGEHRGLKVV